MIQELIEDLRNEDNISLMYSQTRYVEKTGKTHINYTIVCDTESVLSDYELCKKIIAKMEIVKTLLQKYPVVFGYKIKTINELDNEIKENKTKTINDLSRVNMIFSKDKYIDELIEENNTKKRA